MRNDTGCGRISKKHRRIAPWKRMYRHLMITCSKISSAAWNSDRFILIYAEAVLLSGEMISPNPIVRSAPPRTPLRGDKQKPHFYNPGSSRQENRDYYTDSNIFIITKLPYRYTERRRINPSTLCFCLSPMTIPAAFFTSEARERPQQHVFLALYRHLW